MATFQTPTIVTLVSVHSRLGLGYQAIQLSVFEQLPELSKQVATLTGIVARTLVPFSPFDGRVKKMVVLSQTKEYQNGHFFVEFAEHADVMKFYEYTEKIDLLGDVAVKRLFPNLNKTSFDVCASKLAYFLPDFKAPDKDNDVTQVLQVVYGDLKRNIS
ncbi:hypothetical protein OROHE_000634 [Orobanche hederae]